MNIARAVWRTLAFITLVGACGSQGPRDIEEAAKVQRLLVGPDPAVMGGVDHRLKLAIPSDYMPPEFIESLDPEAPLARAVFVATIDDFAPAGDRRADGADVISGAIGWMAPDYVRSAVEETRLSGFSRYAVPDGERYGLEVRKTRMDPADPAKLYVHSSGDGSIMIECAYLQSPDRPRFCQMWSEKPGLPLLEIFFRQERLPDWERLRDGSERLMRSWLAPPDNPKEAKLQETVG